MKRCDTKPSNKLSGGRRGSLKLIIILFGVLIGLMFLVFAAPTIDFVNPTPSDGANIINTNMEINISITESDLDEIKFNWNGTNYTIFNDSLVLMYNFDNVSALGENDTHVFDISGKGNNGTVINAIFNSSGGKFGGAFEFDGSGDYITIPFDESLNITDAITVIAWFKFDSTPLGYNFILDKYWRYSIWLDSNDKLVFNIYNESIAAQPTSSALIAGKWYHVVGTYDKDGGVNNVRLYLDGISLINETLTGGIESVNNPLTIGSSGAAYYFNGTIDEVRIYNRSLSADEIQQLYFMNLNKYDTNKWILYVNQSKNSIDRLDDETYTYFASAKDSVGNENITEERSVSIDCAPPTINLISPGNAILASNPTVHFAANFTEINLLKNTTLYIWNSSNNLLNTTTETITGTSNQTNISVILLYDGVFIWNYYACGNSNCGWNDVNYTLTLDRIFPQIEFVNPTPSNGTNTINTTIKINVSITETNLDEIKFNWNNTNYTIFNDSLVLMYNFDNVSALGENDTLVKDLSNSGNDGVVTNATFNSSGGKFGGAFEFDGVDDYINAGNDSSLNITNEITIAVWAKRETTIADDTVIIGKRGTERAYALGMDISKKIQLVFGYESLGSTKYTTSNNVMPANTWTHIVGTYNGSIQKLYINGILQDDTELITDTIQSEIANTIIGSERVGFFPWNGSIDNVQIWNKALSANEVEQQYYMNLYKYGLDKWVFYINQSDLNFASNTYFVTASDSLGHENLTETRTITVPIKTTSYYDDRKATVIWTGDDWYGLPSTHNSFVDACDAAQKYKVIFSPGIIPGGIFSLALPALNSSQWDEIQNQIDEGFVFPASHSMSHRGGQSSCTGRLNYTCNGTSYEIEINGSRNAIINNLTLPRQNQFNNSEYLVGWIEPYGYSNSLIRDMLNQSNYLISRAAVNTTISSFASWNSNEGLYERKGPSVYGDDDNLTRLNSIFDTVYSEGGIYHLYMHPASHNWTETDKLPQHLDYIGNRTDVWYVGWGQAYMYHYLENQSEPTLNLIIYNNQQIIFRMNVSGVERNKYGLSYPITYEIIIPSNWTDVTVYYKNTSDGTYTQITEKDRTTVWNGIDAYRKNMSEERVYVSKAFPQTSNDMYLTIHPPDTTSPSVSFSLSSNSVNVGDTITSSCTGTDTIDDSPNVSYTTSPSTSSAGTHTTTCTVTDYSGNSVSSSLEYVVLSSSTGGITYSPSSEQLEEGYSKLLRKTQKVQFIINEETHTAVVNFVDTKNKKVEIELEEIGELIELNEGEIKKIDLNDDGYYDLQISVNEVRVNGYADLEFKEIHEEVSAEEKEEQESPSKKEVIKSWMWITGGIVLLVVIGIFIRKVLKKRFLVG